MLVVTTECVLADILGCPCSSFVQSVAALLGVNALLVILIAGVRLGSLCVCQYCAGSGFGSALSRGPSPLPFSQGFSFCLPLASASLKSRRTSSISGLSTFGLRQFRLICPLVPQFKQRSMSLASSSPLLNSSTCVWTCTVVSVSPVAGSSVVSVSSCWLSVWLISKALDEILGCRRLNAVVGPCPCLVGSVEVKLYFSYGSLFMGG